MNWTRVRTIFATDLRYVLRDRTTLLMTIVLPLVVYPLLSVVATFMLLQSRDELARQTVRVAFENAPPEVSAEIAKNRPAIVPTVPGAGVPDAGDPNAGDPRAAVRAGTLDGFVSFPRDLRTIYDGVRSIPVAVVVDRASERSLHARYEIGALLSWYGERLLAQRLAASKHAPEYAVPLAIADENVAARAKMGGSLLARVIPLLLVLFATLGAFYPAIDLTAMEKERNTLETLLVTPTPRSEILVGKFCAVFALTMISVGLNLLSIGLTATHYLYLLRSRSGFDPVSTLFDFTVSPQAIAVILVAMIPMSAILAALMMSVALFARSFREAQNLMTPLLLGFLLPAFVTNLPGFELNAFYALVPIVNLALLIKTLLLGTVPVFEALLTLLATGQYAVIAIRLAILAFGAESVLFRGSDDLASLMFWKRDVRLSPARKATLAWLGFGLALFLVYFVGAIAQARDLAGGVALTQILLIGFPAFLVARFVNRDPASVLRLRFPEARLWPAILAIAVSVPVIAAGLTWAQNRFVPMPRELGSGLEALLGPASGFSLADLLILMAILPAFCEEFLFRGALLGNLLPVMPRGAAIVASALAFSVFHLVPHKIVTITFVGIALGFLTATTGSILPAIVAHAVNNGLLILLAKSGIGATLALAIASASAPTKVAGLAAATILFAFAWRRLAATAAIRPGGTESSTPSCFAQRAELFYSLR